MTSKSYKMAAALACALISSPAVAAPQVLTNGKIYTGNADKPWAQALVINNGIFTYVGDTKGAADIAGKEAEFLDLSGQTVIPGLYDSHIHPQGGGEAMLYQCTLDNKADFNAFIETVRSCADNLPDGAWLQGAGWGPQLLTPTDLTFTEMLARFDEATAGHGAILRDFSNHNSYANSVAMKAAGITSKSVEKYGDLVLRDKDGNLAGIFVEEAARDLSDVAPALTLEQEVAALHKAFSHLNGFGFVGMLDSYVFENNVAAYLSLEAKGAVTMHVGLSLGWDAKGQEIAAYRKKFLDLSARLDNSPDLDSSFAKLSLDGIPPTKTAAFLEPYHGSHETGTLYYTDEQLAEIVTWLDAQGMTVQMHTVGDRAVRQALDAIEAARKANGDSGRRHQLAHACLIDEADIARFGALNAVANFSPMFWYPDQISDGMIALLGKARMSDYCPANELRKTGSFSTAGSDWPVVQNVNPWHGIEALVTRANPFGMRPNETLAEVEAVSLEEALAYYSLHGARVLGIEDKAGSIEAGKSADLVVLNQDIFSIPAEQISETKAVKVYFEGSLLK